MFQRKSPLTFLQSMRETVWPSMGWIRTAKYMVHRVLRLSDSPYRIAGGMAAGASISITPIIGTHIVQAFILSFCLRANYFASLVGTVIGNPWTFPFMWWLSYHLGVATFSLFGLHVALDMPEGLTVMESVNMALHNPMDLFLPWLVGGYMLAALTWPVFFVVFLFLVRHLKQFQKKRQVKTIHKVARQLTGQDN
jgi:hypothetical protein